MKQRLILLLGLAFAVFSCESETETPPGTTPLEMEAPELFGGKVPSPEDNPMTVEGVKLGRMLFYEKRLSATNTMSCGTCHQQKFAFSDGGKAVSHGITGAPGTRNAMALINLAWSTSYNWDGSKKTLEEQARVPMESPIEMHQGMNRAANKLQNTSTYPPLFLKAFGSEVITEENILKALGQFERTLVSWNSKYDQFNNGTVRLTADEEAGRKLFFTPHPLMTGTPLVARTANCFDCHGGANFSRQLITNNGLDMTFADKGLGGITGLEKDNGKFKAPSLRNIALTAPYMHDGRFKTLEDVLQHYNHGVQKNSPGLHIEMMTSNTGVAQDQLGLTPTEVNQVIAFLKTLTDTSFVNNPALSDPFANGQMAQ